MSVHPKVASFIIFCVQRRGKKWPALYDEMCRVAGRGLYEGLHHRQLRELGLSFSLNHIEDTIKVVEAVTSSKLDSESADSHL